MSPTNVHNVSFISPIICFPALRRASLGTPVISLSISPPLLLVERTLMSGVVVERSREDRGLNGGLSFFPVLSIVNGAGVWPLSGERGDKVRVCREPLNTLRPEERTPPRRTFRLSISLCIIC